MDLIRDGYGFTDALRARATNPDRHHALPLRLLGRPALLVRGWAGVRFFYDISKMSRDGAMPAVVRAPLFGKRPVHSLDDDEHRQRKSLFTQVIQPAAVRDLAHAVADVWEKLLVPRREISVYHAAVEAYGKAVLTWAGVTNLSPVEAQRLSRDLARIVENFGTLGLPWLRAMAASRAVRLRALTDKSGFSLNAPRWSLTMLTDGGVGEYPALSLS